MPFLGATAVLVVATVFAVVGGVMLRYIVLQRRTAAARELVAQKDRRYRLFFENNPCPMWVYDLPTAAIIEVNDAAVAQYGYTRDEFASMTLRDLRAPEDAARLENMLRETKPDAEMLHLARHLRKDGSAIDVEVRGHPLPIPDRALRLVVITDCTDRVAASRGVRESVARTSATNEMLQAVDRCHTAPDGRGGHRLESDAMESRGGNILGVDGRGSPRQAGALLPRRSARRPFAPGNADWPRARSYRHRKSYECARTGLAFTSSRPSHRSPITTEESPGTFPSSAI